MLIRIYFFFLLYQLGNTIFLQAVYNADIYTIVAHLQKVVNCYKRSLTILEFGTSSAEYIFHIRAPAYTIQLVRIALITQNANSTYTRAVTERLASMVILNPRWFGLTELITLGRCEHPDIVIAHDLFTAFPYNWQEALKALLTLGDKLFLIVQENEQAPISAYLTALNIAYSTDAHTQLYYIETPKKGLDIPRWTKRELPPATTPRYPIESTYDKKILHKHVLSTPYLPGFNVTTFVMLGGIYPVDKIIRNHLRAFRNIEHNDLVIGNIVVQGTHLKAIDFNDSRWRLKINHAIKTALQLFKSNYRYSNPQEALNNYFRQLQA